MTHRRFGLYAGLSFTLAFVAMMAAPVLAAIDRHVISPFVAYIERSARPDYALVGATLDATTTVRAGFSEPQVRSFRSSLSQRISSRAAMYSAAMSPASAGPVLA